ncbi:MAG TPA: collagen-like protein, partial [Polyangium sp.]|nr:collagen-like protein [Polyangium sp.]
MRTNSIRRWMAALALAGGLSAGAVETFAAVPQTITNQGRLFDSAGVPINETIEVTFSIYDDVA